MIRRSRPLFWLPRSSDLTPLIGHFMHAWGYVESNVWLFNTSILCWDTWSLVEELLERNWKCFQWIRDCITHCISSSSSSRRTDRWVHFQQNAGLRLFVHTWIVHGIDDWYQLTRTFGGFSAQCLSKVFLVMMLKNKMLENKKFSK